MIGLLADHVAGKELRSVSRRWQTYVGRCVFVGVTAYLLYEYWKRVWAGKPGLPAEASVSQVAELGREIFLRSEWVSLGMTVLAAVIAGSDMVAREIRNGTLGLLFLTPLTPRRIVMGKWKAALMIALSLYLCGLPVLAISVYLGGVGAEDLARSAAFTLGLAAVGASISLSFSARLKSAGAAVAATLPLMIVVLLGFMFADYMGTQIYGHFFGTALIVHKGGLFSSLLALLLCLIYLEKTLREVRLRTGAVPGPADLARERRALKLDEVREERASKPRRILRTWRAVWDGNPLLWKEFTLRPALRIREDWRTRGYVLLFALFLVTWVGSGFTRGSGFFNLWATFFTVVALAGGSMLFAPEKEGRQWLLLLSTPVTAIQIVRAKLLCGLIFPEALGLIFLYVLALLAWVGFQTVETFLVLGSAATLFILFAYSLAATASLRSRTARGAFLFAAAVVAFLVTVPPLLSAALGPLRLVRGYAWLELWSWVGALDPVTVLDAFEIGRSSPQSIPPRALEMSLRFFTLYLPVTLLLPVEMVWRFRRIAIRA
jgi:ABC-type transport system involved in multi-copper enzyme maturation permease subunit